MGVPKRLTEMQKRFSEYLVYNEGKTTAREAAIAAGYSKDRASVEASERHIAELAKIRDNAIKKGSFSSAVNAEVNRGKAAGLYIEQKIIKTGKLEDMSEMELEAKMKQIINDYAPILNAKPIEEIKKQVKEMPKPKDKEGLNTLKKVSPTSSHTQSES